MQKGGILIKENKSECKKDYKRNDQYNNKELCIEKNIFVFDVDRTIINTTSWYQACKSSDLLISSKKNGEFIRLNDKAYKVQTEDVLRKFRKNTLNMIEDKVSESFLKKIEDFFEFKQIFKEGEYTDEMRFYVAGFYVAHNCVKIYDNAINFMKLVLQYYGENVEIIFLTSGYEPFIKGVIDGIIHQKFKENIPYRVLGSKIDFNRGKVREKFHMNQFEKQKVIERLLQKGNKVKFLADDSNENPELFNVVERAGGKVLKIEHVSNQNESKTWNEFFDSINLKEILINGKEIYSIRKENTELPEFIREIYDKTNCIGITSISLLEYKKGLKKIQDRISKKMHKEEIKKLDVGESLKNLTFRR